MPSRRSTSPSCTARLPGGRTLKRLAAPHRPSGPAGPLGFTISAEMIAALHAVCAAVPPCPPPADFGATAAWYRLSLLTDNVLSALKSLALPPHLSAAREGGQSKKLAAGLGTPR